MKEAYDRTHESLGGMMIDFLIPEIKISTIVDIFPFDDATKIGIPTTEERVAIPSELGETNELKSTDTVTHHPDPKA